MVLVKAASQSKGKQIKSVNILADLTGITGILIKHSIVFNGVEFDRNN